VIARGCVDHFSSSPKISDLQFLDAGKKYVATIYADGKDASYEKNPQAYAIRKFSLTSTHYRALGGNYASSLVPAGANAAHRALYKSRVALEKATLIFKGNPTILQITLSKR
jgi:hypothetical protein